MDRLTIEEYELLMEAYQYRMVDTDHMAHRQAFLNFCVQAKKKTSKYKEKPVYNTFRKFYDYEKQLTRVERRGKSVLANLGDLLKKGEGDV